MKHPSPPIQESDMNIEAFACLSVLVAEDIRMNQIIISQILKKFNLVPDISNNGIEAIEAIEERHAMDSSQYDIIFMDYRMPELDGMEATKILRQRGFDKPIIALTAAVTQEEREKCIDSGMDDVLTKPYTASCLYKMMTKWIKKDPD